MAQPAGPPLQAPRAPGKLPRVTLGGLRLATGLWLFLLAATHLANHALGLVSVATAEAGREVFLAFWRWPAIEASLVAALLVHVALGLWRLWQRRTLRMRPAEIVQLVLALICAGAPAVSSSGW